MLPVYPRHLDITTISLKYMYGLPTPLEQFWYSSQKRYFLCSLRILAHSARAIVSAWKMLLSLLTFRAHCYTLLQGVATRFTKRQSQSLGTVWGFLDMSLSQVLVRGMGRGSVFSVQQPGGMEFWCPIGHFCVDRGLMGL